MTVTKTALVADASGETSQTLKDVLHALGYLTIESQDGFRLLDVLRRVRPSLVVMDLALKGLDGTEVLHFIRRNEDWMDIPVLVYSEQTGPAARRTALQAGATAFLEKPVLPQALRAAVAELLLPGALEGRRLDEDPGGKKNWMISLF